MRHSLQETEHAQKAHQVQFVRSGRPLVMLVIYPLPPSRSHTDVRPFKCQRCNFSFKTKGNLTKHLQSKSHRRRIADLDGTRDANAHDSDSENDRLEIASPAPSDETNSIDDIESDWSALLHFFLSPPPLLCCKTFVAPLHPPPSNHLLPSVSPLANSFLIALVLVGGGRVANCGCEMRAATRRRGNRSVGAFD